MRLQRPLSQPFATLLLATLVAGQSRTCSDTPGFLTNVGESFGFGGYISYNCNPGLQETVNGYALMFSVTMTVPQICSGSLAEFRIQMNSRLNSGSYTNQWLSLIHI